MSSTVKAQGQAMRFTGKLYGKAYQHISVFNTLLNTIDFTPRISNKTDNKRQTGAKESMKLLFGGLSDYRCKAGIREFLHELEQEEIMRPVCYGTSQSLRLVRCFLLTNC